MKEDMHKTPDCITIASEEAVAAHAFLIPESRAKRELKIASAMLAYLTDSFIPANISLANDLKIKASVKVNWCNSFDIKCISGVDCKIQVIDTAHNDFVISDLLRFTHNVPWLKTETHAKSFGTLCILSRMFHRYELHMHSDEGNVSNMKMQLMNIYAYDIRLSFPEFDTLEEVSAAFTLAGYDMNVDFSSLSS